ncbi:hypothetical protein [Shewanella surugensis]|uniref:Uncharacterized protein n=1 Tax=Shewanella surugensis TaxID=212020 RepID=A0ABT0LCM6_9GAMM|nr:hypothetical protein [Shewanella surugensis]MCL1125097.1 hypothetical protein [Shewanella surugensis]
MLPVITGTFFYLYSFKIQRGQVVLLYIVIGLLNGVVMGCSRALNGQLSMHVIDPLKAVMQ